MSRKHGHLYSLNTGVEAEVGIGVGSARLWLGRVDQVMRSPWQKQALHASGRTVRNLVRSS